MAEREGAARVASAWAAQAPEARFVLISSMAARAPGLSDYAASKRAGEELVAGVAGAAAGVASSSSSLAPGTSSSSPYNCSAAHLAE